MIQNKKSNTLCFIIVNFIYRFVIIQINNLDFCHKYLAFNELILQKI